jgi:hypothetical protein
MRVFSLVAVVAVSVAPVLGAPTANTTSTLSKMLFPSGATDSWTTAKGLPEALPLSDATLRPTKDIKELTHTYLSFEGKNAMEAVYHAGSWNFNQEPRGGFSFYSLGPAAFEKDLSQAKEATFAYSIFFPKGFNFVKGGKLPGLCPSFSVGHDRPANVCYRRWRLRTGLHFLLGRVQKRQVLLSPTHVAHGRQGRDVHVSSPVVQGQRQRVHRQAAERVQPDVRRVRRARLILVQARRVDDDRDTRAPQRRREGEWRARVVRRWQEPFQGQRPRAPRL